MTDTDTMQPRTITHEYYALLEKTVGKAGAEGSSGRVYVPPEWIGKKVLILLVEDLE